jgi:tetratricopeptide (TPR) repeat protein
MVAEGFIGWLISQSLGPEVVSRGLDLLGRRSWRAKLARSVARQADERVPRRRLKDWLERRATWDDLVGLSSPAVERLVESLATALKPRIVLRKERYSAALRGRAERLVPIVIGEFLAALDPSLATSVAHYREMSELGGIRQRVEAVADVLEAGRDFDELLDRLPPLARRPVETLMDESRRACAALLKSVFAESAGPGPAAEALVRVVPEWLDAAPYSAWLALAEIASAHGQHAAASMAFEQATQRGAPDRPVVLARAATEAAMAADMEAAGRLLSAARDIDGDSPFVAVVAAAIREDSQNVISLGSSYPQDGPQRHIVAGLKGNAHLSLKEWDDAIEALELQLHLEPRAAGAALRIAQALLGRATEGKTETRQADLRRARGLALKARDLRRGWLGPSHEAVAVACRAAIAAHAWEEAIDIGLAFPAGQATAQEAASDEVLPLVAAAAVVARRFDVTEAAVEQIADPFEKAFQAVHLAEARQHPKDELVAGYKRCWELATTPEQRFAVQMGLASVGEWPIAGLEELRRDQPEQAEIVTAFSESQRGLYDEAISRLRTWPESSRAQELLGNIYGEAGRLVEAIETFREAHRRFDEPLFSVKAVRLLWENGQVEEAEDEARSALTSVAEGSSTGVELRRLLLEIAATRGNWSDVESLARGLVSEDQSDTEARWWLVLALHNQGRVDQGWRALTQPQPMWPTDEIQARLWLDLHRRFGQGSQVVQQVLKLASEWEESEQVFAAALLTAYELSREEHLPDAIVAELHRATESFLALFPESQLFRAIRFDDVDELMRQVREFVEPGVAEFEDLQKAVVQRWFPYVVLSAFVGRPYAEALLKRAAGCLPQEVQEPAIKEAELQAARDALDGAVAIDLSVLATFSLLPEHWPTVLGTFGRLLLATPAHHDIQSARASLAIRSTMTLGWDTRAGTPRIDEIPQELADGLARRSEWMARAAAGLQLVDIRELEDFAELDFERYAAALASVQLARRRGKPLFAADAGLRLLARSVGIPTFGILALLHVLEERGRVSSETIVQMARVLRRDFVVDLETSREEFLSLAEEDDWRTGPASYVMTRPAFWRNRQGALDLFKLACRTVVARNKELLPGWVGSAIYGVAQGQGQERVAEVAGLLATYGMLATEFDPESFSRLVGAARASSEDLGGEDPLPLIVARLVDGFEGQVHPQMVARMVLAIASGLAEEDRQTVVRVILGREGG